VDTHGRRAHLALTPGEAHDNRLCSALLSALLPQTVVLADRGYDADWIRDLVRQQGAWANIPPKRSRKDPICFSPYLYRARNLVERFFNKIKRCRRVATRYDKLAANYLAFVKLASIRIWLRAKSPRPNLQQLGEICLEYLSPQARPQNSIRFPYRRRAFSSHDASAVQEVLKNDVTSLLEVRKYQCRQKQRR
jgi:transposase